MAEMTFPVSPGIIAREIDLSGPTQIEPTGIPAGVVGTSVRGPAFVPVTVATFTDFISVFGNSDGEKFGPIAVNEWLKNSRAGTFVRVLGAGNCLPRTESGTNIGKVLNAGFVVGNRLPQANGVVGPNASAGSTATNSGLLGRVHFLATLMSASSESQIFNAAGIQTTATPQPILRGVLMAPSGIVLALSLSVRGQTINNVPPTDSAAAATFGAGANAGAQIGTVVTQNDKQEFVLLLNGLKNSGASKNVLTASFDTTAQNYFANVFNTDPLKLESAGHYLYSHYDVHPNLAVITGSGIINAGNWITSSGEPVALLLTSSLARNTGNATSLALNAIGVPNFENFEDRFSSAFTPWIMSQKFGATNKNLFKFYTLTDGAIGSGEFKITLENIAASSKPNNKYGTFDVLVRRFTDTDLNPQVVESFRGCTLDRNSDNFVGKRIGDYHSYLDFEGGNGNQKVVLDGEFPNVSNFVRIELSSDLKNGNLSDTALPVGFRGIHHLVTAGTTPNSVSSILTGSTSTTLLSRMIGNLNTTLMSVKQPPLPLRESLAVGTGSQKTVKNSFTWGVQFEVKDDQYQPNKSENIDSSVLSHARYFPNFHAEYQNPWVGDNAGTADIGGAVLDSDRFNNNMFTLERVQVITGANDRPDTQQWAAALYKRNGVADGGTFDRDGVASDKVRFLDPSKDFAHVPTQKYLKFTLPMIGGFDGLNIFDREKSLMSDVAIRREMDDTAGQFGKSDSTVAAYRKAIDLMEAKQDVDIQLLAIPGIRHPSVTDYAIESTERRFDALYIQDIEEKDSVNSYVTGSSQVVSVTNTVSAFAGRALDSSFAAVYFPDIVIEDSATGLNVKVPPSALVLGAMSLNDAIGYPWFAPAGFTRGALQSAIYPAVELSQQNRDELYTADINPIIGSVSDSGDGVTIFGQKTLLAAQTALDRVNVRRLLIDIRRKIRNVSRTFVFEPNRAATLAAFSARVQPILATIQSQGGLQRYKVKIDTSTTTQADVENNTMRGVIFVHPTKSVEFVSIDFVVGNSL